MARGGILVVGAWLAAASVVQGRHILPSDTIPDYLAKYGIEVQEHTIITDDGYILTAFRLPRLGAPVALLQHGILCSSWFWIDNDPAIAPGIQAYNLGYDVWLTNNRGNIFGTKHQTLNPTLDKAFWDFSWADMGRHDVPSNIKYILGQTGQKTVTYVGHSQGSSQFFVAMTDPQTRALVEDKVNLFVALSPITYMSHQTSLLLRVVTDFHLGALLETFWPLGFLDSTSLKHVADWLCSVTFGLVCKLGVDVVCGVSKEDTLDALINISAHFPAGTAVKCLSHYEQLIVGSDFADYDHGKAGNLKKYNSSTPPRFDLTSAKVPTAFFIGGNDDLGDPRDALRAAADLPPAVLVFNETFPDFSHATWFAGSSPSFQSWFPKMQALLHKYNPVHGENSLVV